MKKTDFAYAAGIVDGEGYISITKVLGGLRKDNSRSTIYTMGVEVGSADGWICQWLKFNWGGSVSCYEDKKEPYWRPMWRWLVSARIAQQFLTDILPYLHLKKPQAELALEFQQVRRGKGHPSTPENKVLQEAQSILMKQLKNRRIKEKR